MRFQSDGVTVDTFEIPFQSIFRCPEGTSDYGDGWGVLNNVDGRGFGWFYPFRDANGVPMKTTNSDSTVVAWYTLNAWNQPINFAQATPFNWINGNASEVDARVNDPAWSRNLRQVKRHVDLAMVLDGNVSSAASTNGPLDYRIGYRLSARHGPVIHGGHALANIAFFDGHVETFSTYDIMMRIRDLGTTTSAQRTERLTNGRPIFCLSQQRR